MANNAFHFRNLPTKVKNILYKMTLHRCLCKKNYIIVQILYRIYQRTRSKAFGFGCVPGIEELE